MVAEHTFEYTVTAVLVAAAVVLIEFRVTRTGLFRRPRYWAALGIMLAFQVPVDGWLTKLGAPIVNYDPNAITGVRLPWDIPVEDFVFGFALITATLLVWTRLEVGADDG